MKNYCRIVAGRCYDEIGCFSEKFKLYGFKFCYLAIVHENVKKVILLHKMHWMSILRFCL